MVDGIYQIGFHTKEGHFYHGRMHALILVVHFKGGKMDGGAFYCSPDRKWRSNPMRFSNGEYVYGSKVERTMGNAWTNRDSEGSPELLWSDSELKSAMAFLLNGTVDSNMNAVDDFMPNIVRGPRRGS